MVVWLLALGIFFVSIVCSVDAFLRRAEVVVVGQKAPHFEAIDDAGIKRSLADFTGKRVVLYFYPKDDTPGCTKQACGLRDAYAYYAKHDIVVLGVSYDTVAAHAAFKKKYELPFMLLSDTDRAIAKKYGVTRHLFGWLFPLRKTFLIDQQGKIVICLSDIDVHTHAYQVLSYFGIHEGDDNV